ncbi:carboxypeptidase-like regulatory domain-containing protein [Paraflavitalea speifideaquila]|uniref:carboxypeptidase-like regulatory domain-containing protein n=1 Tax=Paraflavitalea speifideaquila TaxID=3076558 RepID=UPI0028E869C7|nr:carboxypeptidase-like regulatory domain-containing protein [Paraflavitalea speifideiaquila]
MRTKWITCCLLLTTSMGAWAQQAIIKGKVTDAVNKEVLTGATITLSGTNNAAVTDVNGSFFYMLHRATGNWWYATLAIGIPPSLYN